MEKERCVLIIIHIFITILLIYNLHPHPSSKTESCKTERHDSVTIAYINHSFSIALYHSTCIFALWYSQQYGARIIRVTGILLLGEVFQIVTVTIQHGIQTHSVLTEEVFLDVVHVWTFAAALCLTFRLARKISKQEKDLIHLQLLSTSVSDDILDGRELALV
ncbi:unnamed protein product [Adineta ricciae]|uniref:Uncharacterized protein n=1 Tax=Adineta ricciae TaxID=249248 RepID=A0A815EJX3_ADIRI|nr:unnamed protein product [Adineta ricciae]